MSLFETTLIWLSTFAFSIGVLFMHLRLRNRASLTLIVSFSSLVAWINLKDLVFHKCAGWTVDPVSDAEPSNLTLAQQANIIAEAFANISDCDSVETVSSIVMLTLMLIFGIAFFLSAWSIRRG